MIFVKNKTSLVSFTSTQCGHRGL